MIETKPLLFSPLIIEIPVNSTQPQLIGKVPSGNLGVLNSASWEFYSAQGQQDLRIKLKIQNETVLESARFTNTGGTGNPPFTQGTFALAPGGTGEIASRRENNSASIAAGNYFTDNFPPGKTFPISVIVKPDIDITWEIQNQSTLYRHNVICYLSGYYFPVYSNNDLDIQEVISRYNPGSNLTLPEPAITREITVFGRTSQIVAGGNINSGDCPMVGLPWLRGMVYTATQNIRVDINQGVSDFGVINYRNTQSVIIPAGTSWNFTGIELSGRFLNVVITNLSGANPTNVECWFAIRKNR